MILKLGKLINNITLNDLTNLNILLFQDKGVTEKIAFSDKKAVACLKCSTEGGRKVLVVACKMTPIMVRDALTGQYNHFYLQLVMNNKVITDMVSYLFTYVAYTI